MNVINSGYIRDFQGKEYSFTYDGDWLRLVPSKTSEQIDILKSILMPLRIHNNIISGFTNTGKYIYFVECNFVRNNNDGYECRPGACIILNNGCNYFQSISFYGEIVNYFHRPNQAIDATSKFNYGDGLGGGQIIIKQYSEFTNTESVRVCHRNAKLCVSISMPPIPHNMNSNYTYGIPKSFIRFSFKKFIKPNEFEELYLYVLKLLQFVAFRQTIFPNEIILEGMDEKHRIYACGMVYLANLPKNELPHYGKVIEYKLLSNHISKLLDVLNHDINMNAIPMTNIEYSNANISTFLDTCNSFESVYNFVNQKFKWENSKYNEAAGYVIKAIDELDQNFKKKDGKLRKEFSKIRNDIRNMRLSLENKYNNCIEHYGENLLNDYLIKIYQDCNLDKQGIKDLPNHLQTVRNSNTHRFTLKLDNQCLAAIRIMRLLVYILILDYCGISKKNIRQVLDQIS